MRLGVNIDHVATLRQARRGDIPDVLDAALACARAGADSIVCHLREDRRHIQDRDVERLVKESPIPVNLEMSVTPEIVAIALRVRPKQVTLVPERRQELTTEGGLDVARLKRRLALIVSRFQERGIPASLFIDPEARQIQAAVNTGAGLIELHTGAYANARTAAARNRMVRLVTKGASEGQRAGLRVAAGHGLDLYNVRPIASVPAVEELNIGFSIVARALFVGLEEAVREMKGAIR